MEVGGCRVAADQAPLVGGEGWQLAELTYPKGPESPDSAPYPILQFLL